MQIKFKKEQIVKDKPQSIIIDYGEYKLQCPKWMVKNNNFIADDKYTYWFFNLENIKRELSGNELIKLLQPYIKDQKITVNKPTAPKEYYLNDIKLEPLTFYEQHNSWFMGEITDNKTKITNPCFFINITWEENRKGFKINNPYKDDDLPINYIVTSYKEISTHNEKIFLLISKGQYYELIDFLQSLTLKYKKLKVGYFINGKDGVLNQALVENIGCFTETNIKQILKHMIGDRTYNIDMYTKMVNFKCYQINTAIQLL